MFWCTHYVRLGYFYPCGHSFNLKQTWFVFSCFFTYTFDLTNVYALVSAGQYSLMFCWTVSINRQEAIFLHVHNLSSLCHLSLHPKVTSNDSHTDEIVWLARRRPAFAKCNKYILFGGSNSGISYSVDLAHGGVKGTWHPPILVSPITWGCTVFPNRIQDPSFAIISIAYMVVLIFFNYSAW